MCDGITDCLLTGSTSSGVQEISSIAVNRENNQTASNNKPIKYVGLFFIENSSDYVTSQILYYLNIIQGLGNMTPHALILGLSAILMLGLSAIYFSLPTITRSVFFLNQLTANKDRISTLFECAPLSTTFFTSLC